MATVTNFENKNPLQQEDKTSGNVSPNQAAGAAPNQGVRPAASTFSTLQRYLGANTQAANRLGNLVSSNVQGEQRKSSNLANKELTQANQANQQFRDLTGQTKQYQQDLSAPPQTQANTQAGNYDVNTYSTNLSGQDAANRIAQNEQSLKQFRDVSTGIAGQKQRETSTKEYTDALNAADERKRLNLQRQQNVSSEGGRNVLLQNALGAQARRGGIRGLDTALLSNDQSGQLNALNNILRTNLRDIEGNVKSAETLGTDIKTIAQQQAEAEKALGSRVTGLNTEYEQSLASRLPQINEAKSARVQDLLAQFNGLRGNNEATESFARELGLDKVMAANPANVAGEMQGVRLFNTLKNMGGDLESGLRKALDTTTLEQQAQSWRDVANKSDVSNLNALRALAGQTNDITESRFAGNQTQALLGDMLQKRAEDFRTKDMLTRLGGYGNATESMSGSNFGGDIAAGRSFYTGEFGDILNNTGEGIDKYIYSGMKGNENYDDSLRQISPEELSRYTGYLNETDDVYDPIYKDRFGQPVKSGINYVTTGGLTPTAVPGFTPSGEYGRTLTTAQARAAQGLRNASDTYANQIGYNNLLRIIGGK